MTSDTSSPSAIFRSRLAEVVAGTWAVEMIVPVVHVIRAVIDVDVATRNTRAIADHHFNTHEVIATTANDHRPGQAVTRLDSRRHLHRNADRGALLWIENHRGRCERHPAGELAECGHVDGLPRPSAV